MKKTLKSFVLIAVVLGIAAIIVGLESQKTRPQGETVTEVLTNVAEHQIKAALYDPAVELVSPDAFINSEPFQLADHIGEKIILVDFWTYSCINCQRTLPYLTAWHEEYSDDGLLIVGVHTPEFDFEKEYENVVAATQKWGVNYPVVQDNDYLTWRAYQNRYWPRKYIIDIDGFIVYDHIGEGAYDETEKVIQDLLTERATRLGEDMEIASGTVDVEAVGPSQASSRETYFGAQRNSNFGNGKPQDPGTYDYSITAETELVPEHFYLDGNWTTTLEYIKNNSADARLTFPFDAQFVYMVASSEAPVELTILVDGKEHRSVTVQGDELYELVGLDQPGEGLLEIIIHDPELKAYTFTFG